MLDSEQYDPLDYGNLTASLVRELMTRGPFTLPLDHTFTGPGVYALFYDGDCEGYSKVRSPETTHPIYVGKAVETGARKGPSNATKPEKVLVNRIKEHVQSIESVDNLEVSDFRVRYLVVVPLWIVMAERFLIEHYRPVWNVCIDGFGLHNPGSGRHEGRNSWWDTLHPGRAWATNLKQARTRAEAVRMLEQYTSVLP